MSRTSLKLAIPALAMMAVFASATSIGQSKQRGSKVQSTDQTAVVNGKYYALVIGINAYPAPMPTLKTAEHDAQEIGTTLHDLYGFEVTSLLGSAATREAILKAIIGYRRTVNPNDNLLIYYAGHGYLDKEAEKAYWLPAGADDPLSPSSIMADDLTANIRAIPARHVLVISDSCYSGDLARTPRVIAPTKGQQNVLDRMLARRSRTMMSSGGDEPVSDSGKQDHSVFAYALLNALKANAKLMATASDLFYGDKGVEHSVGDNAAQVPYYKPIPNSSNDDGDFVFTRIGLTLAEQQKNEETGPQYARAVYLYTANRYTEAEPLMSSACDAGNLRACGYLGVMYEYGRGVVKDYPHAVSLFQKGCDGGDAPDCTSLGTMYQLGMGLNQDHEQAARLYRKACDTDDADGCSNLGRDYENGVGVIQNKAEATTLYQKACDSGDARGCSFLKRLQP